MSDDTAVQLLHARLRPELQKKLHAHGLALVVQKEEEVGDKNDERTTLPHNSQEDIHMNEQTTTETNGGHKAMDPVRRVEQATELTAETNAKLLAAFDREHSLPVKAATLGVYLVGGFAMMTLAMVAGNAIINRGKPALTPEHPLKK